MNTVIIADSCSDLPYKYIKDNNIPVIPYSYTFKGREYTDDFGQTISYKEFYDKIRSGEIPTTSQINVLTFVNTFEEYVKKNKSIIYLCFSSALSGTFSNALLARNMVLQKYPQADITVIDTRSESLGLGLLVYHAVEMLKNGSSKEEIVKWVEDNKLRLHHWFTVDDLNYLKRGGRLSGSAAFVGTILNIKPVLYSNNKGELVPVIKAKGRKKALRTLVKQMEENVINPEKQIVAISHGDAPDDANYVAELVRKKFNVKDIIINPIGPIIGSHAGPGTVALFFFGKNREDFLNKS